MREPSTLRIERPYSSVSAYLEGDAWTVDRSDMLLVGVSGVAAGTPLKFEIVLSDGTSVVSGEGRMGDPVAAVGDRPGGTRIRFRQLDAASKGLLRRALNQRKRGAATPANGVPDEPQRAEAASAENAGRPEESAPLPKAPGVTSVARSRAEPPQDDLTSGVRHRITATITAPGNREALLDRLRERRAAGARGGKK